MCFLAFIEVVFLLINLIVICNVYITLIAVSLIDYEQSLSQVAYPHFVTCLWCLLIQRQINSHYLGFLTMKYVSLLQISRIDGSYVCCLLSQVIVVKLGRYFTDVRCLPFSFPFLLCWSICKLEVSSTWIYFEVECTSFMFPRDPFYHLLL